MTFTGKVRNLSWSAMIIDGRDKSYLRLKHHYKCKCKLMFLIPCTKHVSGR